MKYYINKNTLEVYGYVDDYIVTNVNLTNKLLLQPNGLPYPEYLTETIDGWYQPDLGFLVDTAKTKAKNDLEDFYDSKEFRTFMIMGKAVLNTSWFRALISDQIEPLKDLVANGTLTNESAVFNYKSNDGSVIPLNLTDLINIRIKMVLNDINPLFSKKEELISQVDILTTQEDIDNWLINAKTSLENLKATL